MSCSDHNSSRRTRLRALAPVAFSAPAAGRAEAQAASDSYATKGELALQLANPFAALVSVPLFMGVGYSISDGAYCR
jgi:hypothetical protein